MTSARRASILTWCVCLAAMSAVASVLWVFWPSLLVISHGTRIAHTYYIPSDSMLPTLEIDDRVMPLSVGKTGPRRGDVVVFKAPDSIRVSRIAAVAGDTIAMRDGVLILNGHPLPQRSLGPGQRSSDGMATHVLAERLPGEDHEHHVLDTGPSEFDTFGPVSVGSGAVYLLGDNRDRTADSRVPIDEGGVGQIPIDKVLGIVDALYWSKDRARIGVPIDSIPMKGVARR